MPKITTLFAMIFAVFSLTSCDDIREEKARLTFDEPGVYYAAVRVKANRNGDDKDLFTQVKNIARAKVIVE